MLRDIAGVKFDYTATPAFGVDVDFSTTGRTGSMPWTASFAFNNVNELAVPIDQRNNELKAGSEWVNPKGMFRVDYWGSYFENDIQTLTWDNPIRATDFNNGLLPPNGPYDPSGYSNGNGPAFGQAALWPSNTLNSFGTTGMYKALPKTTVNGNVQLTYMRQNESLLPWTLNTSINNPAVLAAFPGLRALPRASAEAAVNATERAVQLQQPAAAVSHHPGALPLQRSQQQDAALRRPRVRALRRRSRGASPTIRSRRMSRAFRSTSRSPGRTSTPTPPSGCTTSGLFASAMPTSCSTARDAASATSRRTRSALAYDADLFEHGQRADVARLRAAPRRRLHPQRHRLRAGPGRHAARDSATTTRRTAIARARRSSSASIR